MTRLTAALAAPTLSERVGRTAAMDFGFGAFLEKFEEYYGKTATRVLVGAMGAAVAAACISLVGHQLISAFHLANPGKQNRMEELFLILQVVTLIWAAFGSLTLYRRLRNLRAAREMYNETKRLHDEIVASKAEYVQKIDDTLTAAQIVLERATQSAVRLNLISQEQVDLLLSLLDTAPKIPE
jgi:hypothetical protein